MTVATVMRRRMVVGEAPRFGEWLVELRGDGYPKAIYIDNARMVELVGEGWALEDPQHLVDCYGPAELCEEYTSVAALDADSAGYGYRAGGPDTGDYGQEAGDE